MAAIGCDKFKQQCNGRSGATLACSYQGTKTSDLIGGSTYFGAVGGERAVVLNITTASAAASVACGIAYNDWAAANN